MFLSVLFNVLLLILLGLLVVLFAKSMAISKNYEEFYEYTIDDVDAIIENLEDLMHRRQIVSDDPDVRKLYKTISIFRDTLIGYRNAANNYPRAERKDKR